MINLDTIANELFNKIRGRFPSVTVGNESAEITNSVKDARFFEFDFVPGKKVSINLDKKSLTIMYSKNLFNEREEVLKSKWFDFLKEVRAFAKKRMLNFDTRDITKSNLDKRDYEYLSTEKQMSESKLYGTSRTSFQNIGTARMVVKHSAPINQESATGRNSNIAGIYIESSQGERFKYPFKHLNGARAMAQHVSEGGTPFDDFGKHVTSLSEEMNKLRKFKTYMNRSSVMAEGLAGYMDVVNERLATVKKTIENIQKPAKYKEMSENFTSPVLEDVPEDIATDWTAQLTIKQFNEELKGVFPYIYKLVSEANAVKELGPEELLGESYYPHEDNFQELYGIDDIALYKEMADDAQDMDMHEFHDTYSSVIDMADEFWEDHQDEDNDDGIHDADESLDPEVSYETHLDNIIKNAKHEQEPEEQLTSEEQAFEDFKMAAANAAAKGEKEFEYPKGSGKKHPTKMDKSTAAKLLADSQNQDIEEDEFDRDSVTYDEVLPYVKNVYKELMQDIKDSENEVKDARARGDKEDDGGDIDMILPYLRDMKDMEEYVRDIINNPGMDIETVIDYMMPAGMDTSPAEELMGRFKKAVSKDPKLAKRLFKDPELDFHTNEDIEEQQIQENLIKNIIGGAAKMLPKLGSSAKPGLDALVKAAPTVGKGASVAGKGIGTSMVQNPLKWMTGIGLYSAWDKIPSLEDLKNMMPGLPNLEQIAGIAKQYALPAAVVIAVLYGGKKLLDKAFGDNDDQQVVADNDIEMDKKDNIPLDEFIKSMYDYTQNSFPKGETAVMTAVQKKYGDEVIDEAQVVMLELLKGQDEEMARIQQLAGVR